MKMTRRFRSFRSLLDVLCLGSLVYKFGKATGTTAATHTMREDHDNIFAASYVTSRSDFGGSSNNGIGSTTTVYDLSTDSNGSSCMKDSETLVINEDIRTELATINFNYFENASFEKACTKSTSDSTLSNCQYDFQLYPTNLNEVCIKRNGKYDEREHSIQCHDPNSGEQLYYQLDHFPTCFPKTCNESDIMTMISRQMDEMSRALEGDSEMICYADYDILRHASSATTSRPTRNNMKMGMLGANGFVVGIMVLFFQIFNM